MMSLPATIHKPLPTAAQCQMTRQVFDKNGKQCTSLAVAKWQYTKNGTKYEIYVCLGCDEVLLRIRETNRDEIIGTLKRTLLI